MSDLALTQIQTPIPTLNGKIKLWKRYDRPDSSFHKHFQFRCKGSFKLSSVLLSMTWRISSCQDTESQAVATPRAVAKEAKHFALMSNVNSPLSVIPCDKSINLNSSLALLLTKLIAVVRFYRSVPDFLNTTVEPGTQATCVKIPAMTALTFLVSPKWDTITSFDDVWSSLADSVWIYADSTEAEFIDVQRGR